MEKWEKVFRLLDEMEVIVDRVKKIREEFERNLSGHEE